VTPEEKTLRRIEALLAEHPPEVRKRLSECEEKVRGLMAEYGNEAYLVLTLLVAEKIWYESRAA
jgi:hypothetical protein